MGEFVSNAPVSRPINVGWKVDWNMNGMLWNYDYGLFFEPVDPWLPIRLPVPRSGGY